MMARVTTVHFLRLLGPAMAMARFLVVLVALGLGTACAAQAASYPASPLLGDCRFAASAFEVGHDDAVVAIRAAHAEGLNNDLQTPTPLEVFNVVVVPVLIDDARRRQPSRRRSSLGMPGGNPGPGKPTRILFIEDNEALVALVADGLERSGFAVDSVTSAADADRAVGAAGYAAVLLDLGLPDDDGLSWLRELRGRRDATPVLILTARSGVSDRVAGLGAGADDYLVKPFDMEELVARLKAVLRRSSNLLDSRLTLGNVALDTQARLVMIADAIRPLPAKEMAVLELLLRRGGNVATKRLLEDQLFGLSGDTTSNAVEVYVYRLRKLLADSGATVEVHTIRGVGYLLAEKTIS